jgi:NAD(P)-dependent dehydrogenase (short-subunit alcohol dehydrogenase family)
VDSVAGKVAFITGGASGIGWGMTRVFLRNGMKVVVADIRRDHLERAARELQGERNVHFIELDVSDRAAMARAAAETISMFGKVHVLCNNAGIGLLGGIKQATYADWDWGMSVNLGGVINGVQTFLPHLLAHGEGGHIVNTSSIGALLPMPGGVVYLTSKAAVVGLSEGLRADLEADHIGVTLLIPGPTATNIHEVGRLRPEKYRDSGFQQIEQQLAQRVAPPVWMDPLATGERVLEAILHDRLFLITHEEFREGAGQRLKAIMAAFPQGEVSEERIRAIGFPVTNPMYARMLEPQR